MITAVAGGSYTVVFIGFGNTEVLDSDGIRPLICENPLDPAKIAVGYECVGRFSGDGKYYDVVVEAVTDFGYKVNFIEYGNSEELPLEHVCRADISPTNRGGAAAATRIVRGDEAAPRPRRG